MMAIRQASGSKLHNDPMPEEMALDDLPVEILEIILEILQHRVINPKGPKTGNP